MARVPLSGQAASKKSRRRSPVADHRGRLFRVARWLCLRYLGGRYSLCGEPRLDAATVYIVHHQNVAGPIQALASWPVPLYPWVYYPFFETDTAAQHYGNYTFQERLGGKRWWTRMAATVCAHFVPRLMRSAGAIPVYRGDGRIRDTFRESVKILSRGESLLIAPDVDYADKSNVMGERYMGFLMLGALYESETGQKLSFVPVYCDRNSRQLVLGRAVQLSSRTTESRRLAAEQLHREMERMRQEGCISPVCKTNGATV